MGVNNLVIQNEAGLSMKTLQSTLYDILHLNGTYKFVISILEISANDRKHHRGNAQQTNIRRRTQDVICPCGYYLLDGQCFRCPTDRYASNPNSQTCSICEKGTVPDSQSCFCMANQTSALVNFTLTFETGKFNGVDIANICNSSFYRLTGWFE